MLALIVLISATFRGAFGENRLIVGAAIAGFSDTHAAAVSVASSLPGRCRQVTPSFQFSPLNPCKADISIARLYDPADPGRLQPAFQFVPHSTLVSPLSRPSLKNRFMNPHKRPGARGSLGRASRINFAVTHISWCCPWRFCERPR